MFLLYAIVAIYPTGMLVSSQQPLNFYLRKLRTVGLFLGVAHIQGLEEHQVF